MTELTYEHVDETAEWGRRSIRRERRFRTHVWELRSRSSMHAAYRIKTRRRNRR